ncbi:recombinase family protein [Serratia proteamaculans]
MRWISEKQVEQLAALDIRVHCLALGGVDLTSPAGKMTMQVISAVAEFERDLLLERTYSGIARAKAAGKHSVAPILSEEQKQTVTERLNAGISISAIAREFNTTRQTILRVKAGLLQESAAGKIIKKSNGYYEIKQPAGFFPPIFYKRVDKRGSRH